MSYHKELLNAKKEFGNDFVFHCGHCNRENPEYLNYHGLNTCKGCLPKVKYFVVKESEMTGKKYVHQDIFQ